LKHVRLASARNNFFVSVFTWGEVPPAILNSFYNSIFSIHFRDKQPNRDGQGWHNYHHAFPKDFRASGN